MTTDTDTVQRAALAAAFRARGNEIARDLATAAGRITATQTAIDDARRTVTARIDEHAKAVAAYRTLRTEAATVLPRGQLDQLAPPIPAPKRQRAR